MRGRLVLALVVFSSLAVAANAATSFPPPALVERLADQNFVVTPARAGDHPRVALKQAISGARRAGIGLRKPYLVYALRLTVTDYGNYPNLIIKDRLVWLFIVPHVRFPIFGTCRHDCFYYADAATVVDASSGRWLLTSSLGP